MSKTVADVVSMGQEVKMVDLRFTDLLGMWHHFTLPARELTAELFDEGIGFDGIYRRFRDVHRYTREFGAAGDNENNLVVLDYDAPTEVTADNFLGHFVFGLDARHVETVICKGRIIVEDRRVTTMDETEVLAFAREMGKKLWDKM